MELISKLDRLAANKSLFLLILFLLSFVFRFPTLFNDFYDVDELSAIVQTQEYMAGDVPGRDFTESKLPLYHLIFKLSYRLSPEKGWVIVHFINIIIVFLTAFFVYMTGKVLFNAGTGALASVFYAVLISSFNRHFMATNGEVVFNLPLAAGFYFFILVLKYNGIKRLIFFLTALLMGICAAGIKLHGLIFFIFLAVFVLLYYPYYKKIFTVKYILFLSGILGVFLIIFIYDYLSGDYFASSIITEVKSKIFYATVKGTEPLYFFSRLIHRQGMLALWHMVLWVPAFIYLMDFIKKKFRADTLERSAVVLFFLLTYVLVFAGLSRLYFHYFMVPYPALCIMSSAAICTFEKGRINFFREKLTVLILIPAVFFLAWNTKDVIIKHFYPAAFYNEGRILYWARAVLIGSFNDYLLPDKSLKPVCDYINANTGKGDRIFVWGDGPSLYYFSERRMGIHSLWPKTSIARITSQYSSGDNEAAAAGEKAFIDVLVKKKPVIFVDTSENGFSTFYYKLTPLVADYINENYYFLNEINEIKIYHRKDKEHSR